jgi:hypothetical protein
VRLQVVAPRFNVPFRAGRGQVGDKLARGDGVNVVTCRRDKIELQAKGRFQAPFVSSPVAFLTMEKKGSQIQIKVSRLAAKGTI